MANKKSVAYQRCVSKRSYASVKDFFAMGELLGKGHTGYVRVVKDFETGKEYVLKTIVNREINQLNKIAEVETSGLKHVAGHPNIIELLGQFEDKSGVHLLMDYCKEGDLCSYILGKDQMKLQEREAAIILKQIAAALRYCHSKNLLHRDVKSENIFLNGRVIRSDGKAFPHVKLADFGSSTILPSPKHKAQGVSGTLLYTAPEVFRNDAYGSEADIWSLGVVLYVALSGILPYYGKDPKEMYRSICTKELHFQESQWASVSNEAIDLILWMLSPDSKSRATADEVLSHPWVVRHCGKQLYLEGQELSAMIATASVVLHPQESENKKKGAEEHKGESRMSLKEKEKEKEKENESNQLRRSEEKGHFVHLASVLCPSSAKSSKVLL